MAIDNIYARCAEASRAIKEGADINKVERDVPEPSGKAPQKPKKSYRKMFDVQANCDKLAYVGVCLGDMKEIFKREKLKLNK